MLWGRSRRAPPLNPHLPIRARQPLLLRPGMAGGRPVHRTVYHGAHFVEPPGRAGHAIFPPRNPRGRFPAAESEFQLLVFCHKCLSIYDPSLAEGVGQKRSKAKDSWENLPVEISQGRSGLGLWPTSSRPALPHRRPQGSESTNLPPGGAERIEGQLRLGGVVDESQHQIFRCIRAVGCDAAAGGHD